MSDLTTEHTDERHEPSRLSRRQALKAGAASMAWLVASGHVSQAVASELARLAQGRPMTTARLVDILQTERAQWNALLERVGPDRMEIAGVEGDWSVKQIVAHLTWYEQAVVERASQAMRTGTFTRPATDMDERNARIAAESLARPTGDVLAEADDVFGQLVQIITSIPDEVLNNAKLLGLPGDIPPWMRVANNSYIHYRQHAESIRSWLARQESERGQNAARTRPDDHYSPSAGGSMREVSTGRIVSMGVAKSDG